VVNGPEQSQESVTAAGGEQGRGGGGGSRRAWDRGSYRGTGEVDRDWGNCWSNPHFMQGTSTRPAAGPKESPRVRPQEDPPPTRDGDGKGAGARTLCLGDKWKISNRFQILFATGDRPAERLLRERNGSISRNFLHFSIKLTLGRGQ